MMRAEVWQQGKSYTSDLVIVAHVGPRRHEQLCGLSVTLVQHELYHIENGICSISCTSFLMLHFVYWILIVLFFILTMHSF